MLGREHHGEATAMLIQKNIEQVDEINLVTVGKTGITDDDSREVQEVEQTSWTGEIANMRVLGF
jgi:hypothetical protein